jgi:hypothetical protein
MAKRTMLLFAALAVLSLSVGIAQAAADTKGDTWWYTSSSGPYQDECASPYYYYNKGAMSWHYSSRPEVTGPFLYHTQGHVHQGVTVVKPEAKKEPVVEQKAPTPPPEPPPAPPATPTKPEGD